MQKIRYQYIPLTILQAQSANTVVEANIQLDRAFNRITGIAVTVVADGGLGAALLVGARTQRQVWVDLIPINMWNADTGVSPNEKYYDTDIQYGSSDVFYIQAQPLVALTSNATVYMVLRLEADLTEEPK